MRCPACGHDNTNLATRCAACGYALTDDNAMYPGPTSERAATESLLAPTLPNVPTDDGPAPSPNEVEQPANPVATSTTEESHTAPWVPKPATHEDPSLHQVAGAAGRIAKAKRRQLGSFLIRHQRAVGIGLAILVVGILAVAWVTINVVNTPTLAQIEQDMAQLAPEYVYTGGIFGPDLTLSLSDVTVTDRSATQAPEGMEASDGVGSTAYGVEAQLTYDDGRVQVTRDVMATYVRGKNDWAIAGELSEKNLSSAARAGVDENKVLANMGVILTAANTTDSDSLSELYDGGDFQIVSNVFDAHEDGEATDDVTIHCSQRHGFCAYEGTIDAHFVFDSGTWVLGTATASEGAAARSYAPLVGTWVGELLSTSSTTGGTCHGAQGNPLTITIDTVGEDGEGQVSGTISCVAHFHESLKKNKSKDAHDEALDSLAFAGTIDATNDDGSGTNIRIACTTAGTPDGSVELELCFGTSDDPNVVTATVTTTHEYEEPVLLFIPHQTSACFVDTYQLWRA